MALTAPGHSMLDNVNPLGLPEIRAMIVYYLTLRDLSRCILVNRAWHVTFLPYLWKNVAVSNRLPPVKFVERHRDLVRSLTFHGVIEKLYASITFPELQSVVVEDSFGFPLLKDRDVLSDFLTHNPSIRSLDQRRFCTDWDVISELTNLRHLTTTRNSGDIGVLGTDFWATCARLESLNMPRMLDMSPLPNDIVFPHLTSLVVTTISTKWNVTRVEFIRRCPNLKKLHLLHHHRGRDRAPLEEFIRLVNENTWPKLCELDYPNSGMSDDTIAILLDNPSGWRVWNVPDTFFGPKAFSSLQTHFATLESLDLEKCVKVTSGMVQEILARCQSLKSFRGEEIHANDIAKGQSWACTTLKTFKCFINCSGLKRSVLVKIEREGTKTLDVVSKRIHGDNVQRRVFAQLSRLHDLEYIRIGLLNGQTGPGLELRIGKGLELLKTCNKVKELDFQGVDQLMDKHDARWMVSHWGKLIDILGNLHLRLEKRMDLESIFFERCCVNGLDGHYDSDEDGYGDSLLDDYDDYYSDDYYQEYYIHHSYW